VHAGSSSIGRAAHYKIYRLVSFGIYVWQQFFFFGNANDWLFTWPSKRFLYPLFWFPGNLIAACAAGVLSYLLIELPLAGWRERLTLRFSGGASPVVTTKKVGAVATRL
jgi:peptidoglycan/LPS O-acetylase OafA/YrhL